MTICLCKGKIYSPRCVRRYLSPGNSGITKPRNSGTPKHRKTETAIFPTFFLEQQNTKLLVAKPKGHGSILMLLSPRSSDQRGLSQTPLWNSGRDALVSTSCLFSINLFGGLILFQMHFFLKYNSLVLHWVFNV